MITPPLVVTRHDYVPTRLALTAVSSAVTQAVQPDPWSSGCGGETRTWRGFEVLTNTESSCSRTNCLTSGGGSGGEGSLALARMNSGTGERLAARPQPASPSAPAISAA